jgi:hypothetical protein
MFHGMVRTRLVLGQYKYCFAAILYYIELVRMEALQQYILGLGWVAIVANGADILLDCLLQATHVKEMVRTREVSIPV